MATNPRRFVLTSETFEEPMVPFAVPVETCHLTTPSNPRTLSFANCPSHVRDVLYMFCYLSHKFNGKIYMVYNEPFLALEQSALLNPHQRALVSTSVTFVFLMDRKKLCEAQDVSDLEGGGGGGSDAPMPFWMSGGDSNAAGGPEASNGAYSLAHYEDSMGPFGSNGSTAGASPTNDVFFLPSQAHKRLTDAVLDLLAVKLGVASFAHIMAGEIKPAIRKRIDFFRWKVDGVQKNDVKNMGGIMFQVGIGANSNGGGFGGGGSQSRISLPGFTRNSLNDLIDALEEFISQKTRSLDKGRVKVSLSKRTVCDANTALWLKLKPFLAMHVWNSPVFRKYLRETAQRFAMTLDLPVPSKLTRTELESLPDFAPMLDKGTLRFMREVSSSNQLRKVTVLRPVDVLAFEYEPHELLRSGMLDGPLQDVPHIDLSNFDIQVAMKQRYGLDVVETQIDPSFETYAGFITNYAVMESINKAAASASHIYNSSSPEYMATMWPHIYFINAVVQTRAVSEGQQTLDPMRLRNAVPMLDSVWSLGLTKASTIMNKLFTLYKKSASAKKDNYTEAMAFGESTIDSLARWRCQDSAVAAYSSMIVKLFGSHVFVQRLLQAELTLKLIAAATAPRWRTARCMLVNYTPTAHGKSLCNHILALMFQNVDGLIIKKTSFTPASLKYRSEVEMDGAGCTVIFDDATVAGVSCNKTASEEDSNMSAMLKNILDSGMTVSNIAGTTGGGNNGRNNSNCEFRSKTITAVHNVQWIWNVNTISTFSTAVKDRSLMVTQQQQAHDLKRVPHNPSTVISQTEVYGDKLDERVIMEAGLHTLAEKWLTRLHVHLTLLSVFGPHLAAPAAVERGFLHGLLSHHLKHIFHISDDHRKDANRHIDKVTDVYALTAHAMGAFHVLDTVIMPYVPLRLPSKNERLSDYLRSMRARANKVYSYRTREDTMLDTVCGSILYTGPALFDAFSQVMVPGQGMHLSAMSAIIRYIKSNKLSQWTVGADRASVTLPFGVLRSYYMFDENCSQLYELKACVLGSVGRLAEHLVESVSVHRSEAGTGGGGSNSGGIESVTIDFKTSALYSLAAYLFAADHEEFENWYEEQASALEALDDSDDDSDGSDSESAAAAKRKGAKGRVREVDASSAPYFHIMFAQLRQALGYGVRVQLQDRTDEHKFIFRSPCKFWWFKHAQEAARDALRDPLSCKVDRHGFLDVRTDLAKEAKFQAPFSVQEINKEANAKVQRDRVLIHWKCLTTDVLSQLDLCGEEPLFEDNYYGVPDNDCNVRAVEKLMGEKPRMLGKRFRPTGGEILMWESKKLAILAAFMDPTVRPAKVFSDTFLVESGFAHYCAPKTFCYTANEQKKLVALGEDEPVRHRSHVVFQQDPSRQSMDTFSRVTEGFYELRQDWEYVKMAELFRTATGRTDVSPEHMKEWHSIHWPTGVCEVPSSYTDYCKEMKTENAYLDDELALAHFPEDHPVFTRMRDYYDGYSSKVENWIAGETPDWAVVNEAVRRHYNHGSARTNGGGSLSGTPSSAAAPQPGIFTFVDDEEELSNLNGSQELDCFEGLCEGTEPERATRATFIQPMAPPPPHQPQTKKRHGDRDTDADETAGDKRSRHSESFTDSFLGDGDDFSL
ncbi:protein Allo56 [Cyprinid herpesvirus 3]|uniref:ORF107R n=2 Tax=Cyprinid herpesvirus 3 TaxID=180230 RepID=A3QMS5_CYHV3|nr:unnamed protein product [Cyprinid herpesvirus 3]ABC55137.1 hypothetical protein [Cyprinid herpesvirus 3]ABG42934.1 protein Allo56 [Cyprinid herpesvirus 3]AIC32462.1 ORF107R [Cyprinid herpesvirus 3]AJP55595.1 protein Allo56 [Cyprinid herpesvirus 3]AJP55750.1 protein Allo56 [Cyprinid herpesvirus 3]